VNHLFHIYECEDCVVSFAVEVAFEEQDLVKCPICSEENLRDIATGELILQAINEKVSSKKA
jgi:predicted nucleic acid-binding Zn ribbon protein